MLDGKLSESTKKLAIENLRKRVYQPVLNSLQKNNGQHWWLKGTNNWNAVCLAGVTASALAFEPDYETRLKLSALAYQQISGFINGFMNDGYCVEGVGYFSYGFGYFALLRDALYKSTSGKIDLFENEKVSKMVGYPIKSEIINGIYPAITDCRVDTKPAEWLTYYTFNNYNSDQHGLKWKNVKLKGDDMVSVLLFLFGDSPSKLKIDFENNNTLRSFFPDLAILNCRPKGKSKNKLGVSIMGGCNGYSHNHNDLGTYTIVINDETVMGDMGGPTAYTSKTFSSERYSLYKSFSSIGHPVPFVDNTEQHESTKAKGILIDKSFTDIKDEIIFDLKSGYKNNNINSLTREMSYDRNKNNVTIIDRFDSKNNIDFETCITSRTEFKIENNKIIFNTKGNYAIEVSIEASDNYEIDQYEIKDHAMIPFTRIGIKLKNKQIEGYIALNYNVISK